MEKHYRKEIDGLRAIAVVAVIVFHTGLALPGGFVGVDIFFVISGYLISGIMKREFESHSFSIVRFWERRIRRIMPPALVTVILTLLVGYLFLLSDDLKELAKSVIANAFFASNFYFWKTIDYFTDTATGLPLLHTWSLAVEEQFYLLFPLTLWFVYAKRTSEQGNKLVATLVAGLFLASLLLSVVGVYFVPQATFYLLPTRAWELLLGVGMTYVPRHLIPTRTIVREFFSWLGLGLIAFSLLTFSEKMPFPGLNALVPCLGAALILLGDERLTGIRTTSAAQILSTRPFVFVGLISYALYLFHWPILVYTKYLSGGVLGVPAILGLLGLLVGLASASLVWLEQPIRKKEFLASKKAIFAFALLSTVLVLVTGFLFWKVLPSRYADIATTVDKFASAKIDPNMDETVVQIQRDEVALFGKMEAEQTSFLLLGDSHARMSIPGFEDFAAAHQIRFAAITWSAAQPLVDYHDPSPNAKKVDSIAWVNAAIDYASRHKIGTLVLVARWDDAFSDLGREGFQQLLFRTVERFRAVIPNLYLMMDIPHYSTPVPRQLVLDQVRLKSSEDWQKTPAVYNSENEPLLAVVDELKGLGVGILDPRPYLLDESKDHYIVSDHGAAIYYDAHHLTVPAAKRYLGQMLQNQFTVGASQALP